MRKFYLFVILCFLSIGVWGQFSLTVTTYSQDFNGLGTATSSPAGGDLNVVSPTLNGWFFSESLANANTTITVGTGSSTTGDTYNFGLLANADRTLGGLQSGSLNPTFGFYFTNNTSITITALAISYTGKTWRVGTATRVDRLDFQYSANATSLTTGTWTDFDVLDYANPGQATGSGSIQHSATITNTLTGISIPIGSTFFIRFTDLNASGADDGMGIDDLSFTASAPTATNYYSKAAGSLAAVATWGTNTDGTGTQPTDFITAFQTFNVVNRVSTTLDANWTVSGAGSKVVTGDGVTGTELIIPNTFTLTGTVDVTNLSTLRLENSTLPTFGTIATGSTVNYAQTASPYVVATGLTYHNLSLTNGTKTFASGSVVVNGNLVIDGVTDFNGAATPFTTVNVAGNFTLQNSATFHPTPAGDGNRITLNCTGSGTQTFSGGDFLLFRLQTLVAPVGTINISLGAGSDMQLANTAGGGLNLVQTTHTLSLNGNTLTMYGAAIFSGSHIGTITGSNTSSLVINKTAGTGNIGSTGFTTGAQLLDDFSYNVSSGTNTTLTLTTPLTVSGDLTMTAGLIDIGANDLTVAGTSTGLATSYVKTSSTGSFILSNVSNTRTAPIGNSTYNPLVITNASGHSWTLRVEDILTVDDPFFASNVLKAVQREWHITPSVNPPVSGADIIFQWDDSDPAQIGTSYNPAENVQVWHEIVNGSPYGNDWVAAGVSQIATGAPGPGVRTATITGWNWYSPFAVSNISGPLPIKLISFNAVKINDGLAKLNWELAVCCSPDSRFEVERSSDARNFTAFASVSGSATNRFYLYNDSRLGKGITYYRLKMTDEEGKVSYSKIVAIVNDNSGLVITNVAPNPVSNKALLTLSAGKPGTVSFEIYNLAGAVVKRWTGSVTEGTNIIPVQVDELAAGVYQVQATGQNAKALVRFIKY